MGIRNLGFGFLCEFGGVAERDKRYAVNKVELVEVTYFQLNS